MHAAAAHALDQLSPREREVAELVAAGQANKQIAATLHLSVNTVESHLKRIFAKLEVRNRAAVTAVLVAAGKAPGPGSRRGQTLFRFYVIDC